MKNEVATQEAPQAIGPYSQAVRVEAGQLIFVSGQLPISAETGAMAEANIEAQTRQSLNNLKSVLKAGGADLADVIKTTVFLKDMNDFAGMNGVYADFFEKPFPARAAVEVARLPKDCLVEIECVAVIQS